MAKLLRIKLKENAPGRAASNRVARNRGEMMPGTLVQDRVKDGETDLHAYEDPLVVLAWTEYGVAIGVGVPFASISGGRTLSNITM